MDFGAFVFGGFGDLAIPSAGGGESAFAEGEVGVGDFEFGILFRGKSSFGLARPDGEFLDEVFGFVRAVGLDGFLQQPERVVDGERAEDGGELIGMGEVELPGGVEVSGGEFGVGFVDRVSGIGFIDGDFHGTDFRGGEAGGVAEIGEDFGELGIGGGAGGDGLDSAAGHGHGKRGVAVFQGFCGEFRVGIGGGVGAWVFGGGGG